MIYWFTGQPGHGKTNQALKLAHEFKQKGRLVYVCNIRKFDAEKAGMIEMTPDQFKDWPDFLPEGSVCLVDEAYEHGMLPKRAPGAKVPHHVEQLAKHRHKGLDFIFVSQSPDKQVDVFVHDLIERQLHVRRRFGTNYVHIREFDRFERNPEKATPLTIKRTTFWKPAFEQYESTVQDTSERKVPWYFIAFAVAGPLGVGYVLWTFGGLSKRLGGQQHEVPAVGTIVQDGVPFQPEHTERSDGGEGQGRAAPMSAEEYIAQFVPRVPSQPWSAPAYDILTVNTQRPPRVFCMRAGSGLDATGRHRPASCKCLTEQGTDYELDIATCEVIATAGQYEPFRIVREESIGDGLTVQRHHAAELERSARRSGAGEDLGSPSDGGVISYSGAMPGGNPGL